MKRTARTIPLLALVALVLVTLACGEAETEVPEPIDTVSAEVSTTPEPTPYWTTIPAIEQIADEMTDLQKEEYFVDILGETVRFNGKVKEVYSDGDISISAGEGLFTLVRLQGVSMDIAKTLNKDQYVEGEGTLSSVDNVLILTFGIQVTSLEVK